MVHARVHLHAAADILDESGVALVRSAAPSVPGGLLVAWSDQRGYSQRVSPWSDSQNQAARGLAEARWAAVATHSSAAWRALSQRQTQARSQRVCVMSVHTSQCLQLPASSAISMQRLPGQSQREKGGGETDTETERCDLTAHQEGYGSTWPGEHTRGRGETGCDDP